MLFAELEAITVDGYGTLLELIDPVEHLGQALRARGVERAAGAVAYAFQAEARYYRLRAHLGRDADSLRVLRHECVAVFLRALDAPLEPETFVEAFMGALVFQAVPGATETVERLARHGLRLAVVANWDCSLPQHLEQVGLARYFTTVVTSARAGVPKPDPALFRLALEELGVEPGRALHVGDEEVDEVGARRAGMRFAPAPLASVFRDWP
ncbi:MAG: hydrolase [Thermoleophilia bacterium]